MGEDDVKKKKRSFTYKIKKFADIYQSTEEYLGEGSCGTVATYYNVEKKKEYAVKIIEKTCGRVRKKVLKEIEILHHCKGHENIVQLFEFYEEDQRFYLVFEKMEGMTLLDYLDHHGPPPEEEASKIVSSLASALLFLHSKGVAHRDIKLENILCSSLSNIHPVKICDFDLSTDFGGISDEPNYGDNEENLNLKEFASAVGSADYMAPEVVRVWLYEATHYSEQCDIWSLGVVLYILLSGYKPFCAPKPDTCTCRSPSPSCLFQCEECKEAQFEEIKAGVVRMEGPEWAQISEGGKDLVSKLLVRDPHKRLDAQQILRHPWIVSPSTFTQAKSSPIPYSSLKDQKIMCSSEEISTSLDGDLELLTSLPCSLEDQVFGTLWKGNERIFSIELDDFSPKKIENINDMTLVAEKNKLDLKKEELKQLQPAKEELNLVKKVLNFGSCDSGNVSGISFLNSPSLARSHLSCLIDPLDSNILNLKSLSITEALNHRKFKIRTNLSSIATSVSSFLSPRLQF